MIRLDRGDKIAVVSLSSGILGEDFCSHQLKRGTKRLQDLGFEVVYMENALKGIDYLKAHPEKRAEDLLAAFEDKTIKGIFCAIGGDDTFRLAPYIFNERAEKIIRENSKFFMGYSDTTIDHLMLYKLGLRTFYGLSVLTCFAELDKEMLPYSKVAIENIFTDRPFEYTPSPIWYEERTDFSPAQLDCERISHRDDKGYELLQGAPRFEGHLLGGCLESIYELIVGERYSEEKEINERYGILPSKEDFNGAILFLETSEERPEPQRLKEMLELLKAQGILDDLAGILVGKPQNEVFYEEYKQIYREVVDPKIPVVYNANFGHAYPKMLMQYGAKAIVDTVAQKITIERL
ncbi:MAG: LD-carboxypeptidase [Peptostreptococcaceae bacterium]|nr:LD-carboxypeptidase [Peptostreptococcaceae bacterium]